MYTTIISVAIVNMGVVHLFVLHFLALLSLHDRLIIKFFALRMHLERQFKYHHKQFVLISKQVSVSLSIV